MYLVLWMAKVDDKSCQLIDKIGEDYVLWVAMIVFKVN